MAVKVTLGKKYRDTLHGFEGIATAQTRYITGCDQIEIQWLKNGEPLSFWLDITRLEGVKIPPKEKKPGGPQNHAPCKSHS